VQRVDVDVTYGAESLVCVCFHAEETWFHLVVAAQWWVKLDAHDLRLASRTLDLVLQVHPLMKRRYMSKTPCSCPSTPRPSTYPSPPPSSTLQKRQEGDGQTGEKTCGWVNGRRVVAHLGVDGEHRGRRYVPFYFSEVFGVGHERVGVGGHVRA
jgi:hypothetical protein